MKAVDWREVADLRIEISSWMHAEKRTDRATSAALRGWP